MKELMLFLSQTLKNVLRNLSIAFVNGNFEKMLDSRI